MSSSTFDGHAIGSPSGRQTIQVSVQILEELRRRTPEGGTYDDALSPLLWPRVPKTLQPLRQAAMPPKPPVGQLGCASSKRVDGELRLCRAAPGDLHVWWSRTHKRVTWR